MYDTYKINQLESRISILENTLHASRIQLPKNCIANYIINKENNKIEICKWTDNKLAAERLINNILKAFANEHNLNNLSTLFYKHNILEMNTGVEFSNGVPVTATVISKDFTPDDGISLDLKINRNDTNEIEWITNPKYINNLDFSQLPTKRLLINIARIFARELKLAASPGVNGYSHQDRLSAENIDDENVVFIDVRVKLKIPIGATISINHTPNKENLIKNNYTITCKE